MSRLHAREDKVSITGYLRMTKNAVIKVVNPDGTESTITPTELLRTETKIESVTTTNVITALETGTHFILNSATAFVSTLPAPVAGMEFWFHVGATEPTTTHTVVTNASANIIVGNLASPDMNAASDVGTVADADTISFVASKALHGDFAHVFSDGTNWYIDGMCKAFDGMTTTQAS